MWQRKKKTLFYTPLRRKYIFDTLKIFQTQARDIYRENLISDLMQYLRRTGYKATLPDQVFCMHILNSRVYRRNLSRQKRERERKRLVSSRPRTTCSSWILHRVKNKVSRGLKYNCPGLLPIKMLKERLILIYASCPTAVLSWNIDDVKDVTYRW